MRSLIALAVMGVCSAYAHQAYTKSHGGDPHDTQALASANAAFADAYVKQLSLVSGGVYHSPAAVPSVASHHGGLGHHGSHGHNGGLVHHGNHGNNGGLGHHGSHGHQGGHGHNGDHGHHGSHGDYEGHEYNAIPLAPGSDTPAVAAAKAKFFALYNQQAALAAAAPDDYQSEGYGLNSGSHDSGAYNPGAYNSGAYNPAKEYNPGAHDTGAYNPGTHDTGAYNPGAHDTGAYKPGAYDTGAYNPARENNAGAHDTGAYSPKAYNTGEYNQARENHAGAHYTGAYSPAAYNTGAYNPAVHGGHQLGAHHGVARHGVVGDTPEVAAAKAQFFSLFKMQAAAAAAAPDHSYD
ncbi:uncharacterized PPE family protein PPE62-like [Palaemon carinicauda]|uniref:uncharacterized PPE family protein PPE62-like n=1 Tax=Palaemon carinicauda TaxID=392227 RepID=UPI0035B587C8